MVSELEKVPINKSGVLNPNPKVKSNIKPRIMLPSPATMLSSKIKPGDTHGEAIVPLAAPKMNDEISDPFFFDSFLNCKKAGS